VAIPKVLSLVVSLLLLLASLLFLVKLLAFTSDAASVRTVAGTKLRQGPRIIEA
jgi:hypothetical protein